MDTESGRAECFVVGASAVPSGARHDPGCQSAVDGGRKTGKEESMDEGKTVMNEVASDAYDASDRPFDFVMEQGETALICESDPATREKMVQGLQSLGYSVKEADSARDTLKKMRFHAFDVLLLSDRFEGGQGVSELLGALELLDMPTRRRIYVALVGDSYRTMDSMAAFYRSVNLVVSARDLADLGAIIRRGVQENKVFYYTLVESLKKMGRA